MSESIEKSPDIDPGFSKVDQECDRQPSSFKVIKCLGGMDFIQIVNCLDFYDDTSFDDQIGYIMTNDYLAVIHINGMLLFNTQPLLS